MPAHDHILSTCRSDDGKSIKTDDDEPMDLPRYRRLWHDRTTLEPELVAIRFPAKIR